MQPARAPVVTINAQTTDVPRLLLLDDDLETLEMLRGSLSNKGLSILCASDARSGLDMLVRHQPEILLLSLLLRDGSGIGLLTQAQEIDPGLDIIVVGADQSADSAVEVIQMGAYDYLTKPIAVHRLERSLQRWLTEAGPRRASLHLDQAFADAHQFEGIVGRTPAMLEVFTKLRRAAPHYQIALITGETGTGKELAARALHQLSPAADGPFVVCNCAAMTESLFESELFGHVKGAFTGAFNRREGLMDRARGGTLVLDEISEMPLASQAKLLRALQHREVRPVGTSATHTVDVRIIAASNRDLRAQVAQHRFREDLYHRLAMLEITMPRLVNRRQDLPLLQRHFLREFSIRYQMPGLRLTRRARAMLQGYRWPGNVRELENVIGGAAMMSEGGVIDVGDLPESVQRHTPALGEDELVSLEVAQRRHVRRVLEAVGGNRMRAAEVLGISRATLYRLLNADRAPAADALALREARF